MILHSSNLRETRIHHNKVLGDAEVVMVFNDQAHYNGAGRDTLELAQAYRFHSVMHRFCDFTCIETALNGAVLSLYFAVSYDGKSRCLLDVTSLYGSPHQEDVDTKASGESSEEDNYREKPAADPLAAGSQQPVPGHASVPGSAPVDPSPAASTCSSSCSCGRASAHPTASGQP